MNELLLAAGSAFWFGVLTSISPCPLATNVAAVSFLGREVEKPRRVLLRGLAYTLGRALAYIAVAFVLIRGLLTAPGVSMFLQQNMNRALGPILIVTAILLLGLIKIPLPSLGGFAERIQERGSVQGVGSAALLGLVFALSFCPVSAALFFGSLLGLALQVDSAIVLPTVFGIGTALPVFLFAVLVALGARSLGKAFQRLGAIEKWGRWVTAAIFFGVGLYMTLAYTLEWIG